MVLVRIFVLTRFHGFENIRNVEETLKTEWRIPAQNWQALQDKLGKINRRAAKLGVPPIALNLLRTEQVPEVVPVTKFHPQRGDYTTWEKTGRTVPLYVVSAIGQAPKLNGWTLVGTLQHVTLEDGAVQNIVRNVPGETIPASFRTRERVCDHCKTIRRRIDTHVVRHDSGEYKQVGSNCIADFLGATAIDEILNRAEWLSELAEYLDDCESIRGGRGPENVFDLTGLLTVTCAMIRLDGWRSRKTAQQLGQPATVDSVCEYLFPPREKTVRFMEWHKAHTPTTEDAALAEQVAEWAAHVHETERRAIETAQDDYLYNLSVLGRQRLISTRSFGLACSMVSAYNRAMERETKRAAKLSDWQDSRWQGAVGERRTWELLVVGVTEMESDFGPVHLYRLADAGKNLFVWFSSSAQLETGKTYKLIGTVKAHKDYHGVQQTTLTRCAIAKPELPKELKKAIKTLRRAAKHLPYGLAEYEAIALLDRLADTLETAGNST